MCPNCYSLDFGWLNVSGKGSIYSWSTLYRPFHPAFASLPRTTVIVELEDFPEAHLVSELRMHEGMTEADLRIGLPVEVVFVDANDEIALPEFRLVRPRS
jgi:uncharacterized OB-fold protein